MEIKFIVIIVIALISIFIINFKSVDKQNSAQPGEFSSQGKYENVTPLKHDLFKQMFVVIVTLSLFDNLPWFDAEKPWSSRIGRACIVASCFVIYHAIVQPVINLLPRF